MTNTPDEGWEIPDFGTAVPEESDDAYSLDHLVSPVYDDAPAVAPRPGAESAPSGRDDVAEPANPDLPMVSVTNPSSTVSAIVSITGRLHRVELNSGSRSAASMSEAELAQEIMLVGRLAGQKASSELFAYLVDQTAEAGQDPVATGRFLRDDVGLTTPEQAAAAQAEAFGASYRERRG